MGPLQLQYGGLSGLAVIIQGVFRVRVFWLTFEVAAFGTGPLPAVFGKRMSRTCSSLELATV